jgi:Raf kinase inhibitor-like YbhB/YbcL family protein
MKTLSILLAFCWSLTLNAQTFTLKSNELGGQATEQNILNGSGCTGSNLSPQLYWENPPIGTKSYAVTLFDEDAPTGSGWWHWLIFDIPLQVKELKKGVGNISLKTAPSGSVQSITDFKSCGYNGPCPPAGDKAHRYVITVYALKTEKLGIDTTANPALVGFLLNQNAIEKASIMFYYKR